MTEQEFLYRFHHFHVIENERDYPLRTQAKPAGVLIPIVRHKEALTVLFTKRAAHLKHHPGQISFPGGRQEEHDSDVIDAALRETEEEIGIPRSKVEIIGQLAPFKTVSGYEMRPVVGFIPPDHPLTLDINEVSSAFEVPLAHVLDQNNHFIHWINRQQYRYPIYFIPANDVYIWGATAAVIRNLSNHIHLRD